jgi:hypothetical protein
MGFGHDKIHSEFYRDPASVGDIRHPASGLANCRLAVLTHDVVDSTQHYNPK